MLNTFLIDLREAYNSIVNGDRDTVIEFKNKWNIERSIGEVYQNLCKKELRKDMGSFYTPLEIVEYMVSEAFEGVDFEKNKYVKILDPSCGGGYFLIEAFKLLKERLKDSGIGNIEEHILKHIIHGTDTDENAIMICKIEFYDLTGFIPQNLVVRDFLLDYEDKEGFDIIIGNPPYMGHKLLTGDYRERLYSEYNNVFFDKGDMSYCFIKKSIDMLKNGGRLLFFTSRYILEALNGYGIRDYLRTMGHVKSLIDFYGVRVVKGAGVDNIIIDFIKNPRGTQIDVFRLKENAKGAGKAVFEDIKNSGYKYVKHIEQNLGSLDNSGWILLTGSERNILLKIEGLPLKSICDSFQGIISGCDKAFVISREKADALGIENDILRPWIKNKNVESFHVSEALDLIIYLNSISDKEKYKAALKHVSKYYAALMNRRECKKGIKEWYHLQWGRDSELFENKKIIYPYKASRNRFAIDSGNYFSADIYAVKLKEKFQESYTYEFLVGVLNSSIYEFYIKSMAKKLGDDLYEYYPNKIMTLRIPDFNEEIDDIVRLAGEDIRGRVDRVLKEHFGITDEEFNIIREWCKR